MKMLAFNGSPRKNMNTATLLKSALEGAASQGAETELIHLYDINYKGCMGCLSCKLINGPSYGKCAFRDDLTPVLKKVEEADAIVLGSPIYFGAASGEMRSFMERLLYPYHIYEDNYKQSLFKGRLKAGFIYNMNVKESRMKEWEYEKHFKFTEMYLGKIFGSAELLIVLDTFQFDDYSKYYAKNVDPIAKAKRRQEEFPKDCQRAFELGVRLTQ